MTVSFCCSLMNRGKTFTRLVESLQPSLSRGSELIVADYGSTDIDLRKFDVRVVRLTLPFRRANALNAAAREAKHSSLFFVDADMLMPADVDRRVLSQVRSRQCIFPICYFLNKGRPAVVAGNNGWWCQSGFGMCGFTRDDFYQLGTWAEHFTGYGKEDRDIHLRATQAGLKVIRENWAGLFHQWHMRGLKFQEKYH